MADKPTRHQLLHLTIVGGFLDGQTFDFDGALNTFIGARGTGKTTVLELVRWAFDALPSDQRARQRLEELVARNLRGGRVDLAVRTRDGLEVTVSRAPGEDPIVTDAEGAATDIAVRSLFRLDAYSQNEVERIADRQHSQLGLLDGFEAERIAELDRSIAELRRSLQLNATRLAPLRKQAADLDEQRKELPAVAEKLKAYGEEGGEDAEAINQAHEQKALRDREARALAAAKELVDHMGHEIKALAGRLDRGVTTLELDELAKGPNGEAFDRLGRELTDTGRVVDESLEAAVERLRATRRHLNESESELGLVHKRQEVAFQKLLERHKEAQGKASERSRLERRRVRDAIQRRQSSVEFTDS